MDEKLKKLYNTLLMVEVKGENTKIMADSLRYLEQLYKEAREAHDDKTSKPVETDTL